MTSQPRDTASFSRISHNKIIPWLIASLIIITTTGVILAEHTGSYTCPAYSHGLITIHRCHAMWTQTAPQDKYIKSASIGWSQPMDPCVVEPAGVDPFSFSGSALWVGDDTNFVEVGVHKYKISQLGTRDFRLYSYCSQCEGSGSLLSGYSNHGNVKFNTVYALDFNIDTNRWVLWEECDPNCKTVIRRFPVGLASNAIRVDVGGETDQYPNDMGVLENRGLWIRYRTSPAGSLSAWAPFGELGTYGRIFKSLSAPVSSRYRIRLIPGTGTISGITGGSNAKLSSDHHHMLPPVYDSCGNQVR